MSRDDFKERRATPRHEMVLKVEYDMPNNLVADYLMDLGMGGLFICTKTAFQIGQTVELSLSFPGSVRPIRVSGVVRWRRPPEKCDVKHPPGVGVEFLKADDEPHAALKQLLDHQTGIDEPLNIEKMRPLRILLVEENPYARELFQNGIERFHRQYRGKTKRVLKLLSVTTAEHALTGLEDCPVDLAVIDFFLPGTSGADLIRKIRENPELATIPILALGIAKEGAREEALEAGADFYLNKPVLLKPLLGTLHMLIRSHSCAAEMSDETEDPAE